MSEHKVPLHETQPVKNIAKSVSRLIMPDLSPLIRLLIDMRAGISEERAACLRKKEQIKAEGFAAAMRLMLPEEEELRNMAGTYFDRLNRSGD